MLTMYSTLLNYSDEATISVESMKETARFLKTQTFDNAEIVTSLMKWRSTKQCSQCFQHVDSVYTVTPQ